LSIILVPPRVAWSPPSSHSPRSFCLWYSYSYEIFIKRPKQKKIIADWLALLQHLVSPGPHLSWLLPVVTVWQTKLSGRISWAEGARRRTHKTFLVLFSETEEGGRTREWLGSFIWMKWEFEWLRFETEDLDLRNRLQRGEWCSCLQRVRIDSIRLYPLLSLSLSLSELKFFSFPKSKLEIVCGTLDATWRFLLWLASKQWSLEFKCEDSVRRRWWMRNPK
jgi:hypothetical protein